MNVKKSLYVFLCSIMGALLFLILHQILAFGYLMLLYANYQTFSFGLSFIALMALDYLTLIIVIMLGAWYGIWLGIYWFGMVYETNGNGFIEHMVKNYWPSGRRQISSGLRSKIAAVESKLEGDFMELENLSEQSPKAPAKKRIVRRKISQ